MPETCADSILDINIWLGYMHCILGCFQGTIIILKGLFSSLSLENFSQIIIHRVSTDINGSKGVSHVIVGYRKICEKQQNYLP